MVQNVVLDYEPVRVQTVIVDERPDEKAGKRISRQDNFPGVIMNDEVMITKEFIQLGLDAGEMLLGMEVYE